MSRKYFKMLNIFCFLLHHCHKSGSLKTVARELARYKLDLVGVQEFRLGQSGTVRAGDYTSFYRKGNESHQLGTDYFIHYRTVTASESILLVIGCHI